MKETLQTVIYMHPQGRMRKLLTRWEPYVKSDGKVCLDAFGFPVIKALVRDGRGSFWAGFGGNRLVPITER